jgi:hypothetical protein
MTRYLTLLVAAYTLIAIETTVQSETGLVAPFGSFVWMLLPWLATLPSPSASVLAAAFYGLLIDACSNHHPGLLIAATIVSTCVLQRMIAPKSLESPLRVFVVSFACGCLMAMLVATCSLLAGGSSAAPNDLVRAIAIPSTIAAVFSTLVAVVLQGCGNLLTTNRISTQ